MEKNKDLHEMFQYKEFDQIKEMLFCMDGFSCSDKELAEIINLHDGIDNCFEQVKSRYIAFLQKESDS